MRQIKFRAWDGKRMTTSGIMFNSTTGCLVVPDGSQMKLMQFTGLHDKNGVEIYEGDVVAGYKCKFPVIWENGAFMWGGEFLGHDIDADDQGGVFISPIEGIGCLEIIGNIHQTPELL
jgi:hypothetical protein